MHVAIMIALLIFDIVSQKYLLIFRLLQIDIPLNPFSLSNHLFLKRVHCFQRLIIQTMNTIIQMYFNKQEKNRTE